MVHQGINEGLFVNMASIGVFEFHIQGQAASFETGPDRVAASDILSAGRI